MTKNEHTSTTHCHPGDHCVGGACGVCLGPVKKPETFDEFDRRMLKAMGNCHFEELKTRCIPLRDDDYCLICKSGEIIGKATMTALKKARESYRDREG